MPQITFDTYGKTGVRLMQVMRDAGGHHVVELNVKILFDGDFGPVYEGGDNSGVLPTDTMKNAVYALARQNPIESIEAFAHHLAQFFLTGVRQLRQIKVSISQTPWQRIANHTTAFQKGGEMRHTVELVAGRERRILTCGLTGLQILKTGGSAFTGFMRDKYTTLPETSDRLLGTVLEANWTHSAEPVDYSASRQQITVTLLESFASHQSLSVQHTLFAMGQSVLDKHASIRDIHLVMPNRHCLLFDLSRFGLDNPNQIFVPTEEPSGYIEARVSR